MRYRAAGSSLPSPIAWEGARWTRRLRVDEAAHIQGQWMLATGAGPLLLRRATPADVEAITAIHEDTMRWAFERGYRKHGPYAMLREDAEQRLAQHAVYVAEHVDTSDDAIATVTLTDEPHPLWADMPEYSLYLYALAVRRDYAGKQIGRALLDWAAGMALAGGYATLRLECDADNPRLPAYYMSAGFVARGVAQAGEVRLLRLERAVRNAAAEGEGASDA